MVSYLAMPVKNRGQAANGRGGPCETYLTLQVKNRDESRTTSDIVSRDVTPVSNLHACYSACATHCGLYEQRKSAITASGEAWPCRVATLPSCDLLDRGSIAVDSYMHHDHSEGTLPCQICGTAH